MSQLTAQLDQVAEALDRMGQKAIAAVLDNVSEELAARERCAENADEDEDEPHATASANFPSFSQQDDPTVLLTGAANRLLEATRQYGAKSCKIDGQAVELVLDRGQVETTAALEFCSRDEAGKPQLRMTFRCGGDKMVRWASLDSFDADTLTTATTHVFGTGQNYGANVVTAKARKPTIEIPRKCARSDTQHGAAGPIYAPPLQHEVDQAANWLRDLFGSHKGTMSHKDLLAAMRRFKNVHRKPAMQQALKDLQKNKFVSKKGDKWKWARNLTPYLVGSSLCDADALKVSRAMTALIDEIATASATWLVAKKVSREPYQRALDRIRSLEERGVDVEKHTLMRLSKTNNVDKIEGLWQAAMHAGLGRVASEAKKKFRQLTGKNPIKW